MLNIIEECDEDGRRLVFDRLVMPDSEPVDDVIADTYDDELKEDLVELTRQLG